MDRAEKATTGLKLVVVGIAMLASCEREVATPVPAQSFHPMPQASDQSHGTRPGSPRITVERYGKILKQLDDLQDLMIQIPPRKPQT